jgi:DNA polymerase III sliding clamp (beta) subunit (PCNA family)
MLIRREALAAVLPATTADETRLNAVQVEPKPDGKHRCVATNGHVLIIADETSPQPDDEYPSVSGGEFHGSPSSPVLLPSETVKRLIASVPKKRTIPILGSVQLGTNGSPGTLQAVTTDLDTANVMPIRPMDATFPAYDRVIPKDGPDRQAVTMVLTVEVLETIIRAAKASGAKIPTVLFSIPSDKPELVSALTFKVCGVSNIQVSGVAMPCRI